MGVPRENSSRITLLKAGISLGLRLVIIPLSETTSLSTHCPPALAMSVFKEGQEVSVRPLTAPASISIQGPWQIAATGFPESTKFLTNCTTSLWVRSSSGFATPPGSTRSS
jgi:hypothetical protein